MKYYLNICSIIYIYIFSFLISFKKFSHNFNEDISRLLFAFVGSVAGSGSVVGFVVSTRVGILSKFFIGNNQFLKLLRTFSLALNNNPKLFKKDFFLSTFVLFSKFFN